MAMKQSEFAALLDKYMVDLFRYAYWLVGKKDIADDLVQETFLRAWRYRHTLKSPELTKSWLITILKRENARRYANMKAQFSDVPLERFEANETELDTRPEALALNIALKKLSDDYREPLVMQVLMGLSGKEIASILGISPEAVMTRLHRGRSMLKKQLSEETPDRDEAKK